VDSVSGREWESGRVNAGPVGQWGECGIGRGEIFVWIFCRRQSLMYIYIYVSLSLSLESVRLAI
jgi:hypothetical protein